MGTALLDEVWTLLGGEAKAAARVSQLLRTEHAAFMLTEAIVYQGTDSPEARRRLEDLCDALDNEPERVST